MKTRRGGVANGVRRRALRSGTDLSAANSSQARCPEFFFMFSFYSLFLFAIYLMARCFAWNISQRRMSGNADRATVPPGARRRASWASSSAMPMVADDAW